MIRIPATPPAKWLREAHRNNGWLAGGCLRDLVLGRLPPKDIDIFVPGLTEADVRDGQMEKYIQGSIQVENFEKEGTKYQVIKHRFESPYALMENFDIGLCKIAFYDNHWYLHEDFVKDYENRTLTILRDDNINHEKHLASVRQRYPGYKVVKPDYNHGAIFDFNDEISF